MTISWWTDTIDNQVIKYKFIVHRQKDMHWNESEDDNGLMLSLKIYFKTITNSCIN